MKTFMVFVSILLISLGANSTFAQDSLVTGDKISLEIVPSISNVGNNYEYAYKLSSKQQSKQGIWQFSLIAHLNTIINNMKTPTGWRIGAGTVKDYFEIHWGSPGDFDIQPGNSLSGFSFTSTSLPGIISFYAEGYHPAPSFEEGMATDIIPGYSDLTPYGPGIVGKTVGPVLTPEPFVALDFLDTIISYKHQAHDLGWIDNQGIANSLDAKLDNAKSHLENGNEAAARNQLRAFVNEVEAQKDQHLSSEAYALLKYNAEYLIDYLPAPPEFPIPDLPAALTISSANASAAFSGDNFIITGKNHKADGTQANDGDDRHGVVTTTSSARTGFLNGLQTYQRDNVNGSGGSEADIVQQALAFDIVSLIDTVLANVDQTMPVNVAGTFGSLSNPLIVHATQGIQSSGNVTGAGILLVDGPLFVSGTINWTGLVIQRNNPFSGPATSVSTSLTITGGILVYNTGPWGASVQVSNQLIIRNSQEVLENLRLGLAE